MTLSDTNTVRELCLRDVKTPELSNPMSNRNPVYWFS
jgi:hypothetical protein